MSTPPKLETRYKYKGLILKHLYYLPPIFNYKGNLKSEYFQAGFRNLYLNVHTS